MRTAIVAAGVGISFVFIACSNSDKDTDSKRIAALEAKMSGIELKLSALDKQVADNSAHLQHIPQQQDFNDIKQSIQSLKSEAERLKPLLAAFLVNRQPGEQNEQWLNRVKQQPRGSLQNRP
ncbi:MAG: hypothetical protein LAQ69_44115 [Acidobacteriia bacterium]|nr:hypothetical protein [Terriglobia bacterium]